MRNNKKRILEMLVGVNKDLKNSKIVNEIRELNKLEVEGVADRYAEKEFNIPDDNQEKERLALQQLKNQNDGELIGTVEKYGKKTNIYLNPNNLQNFEANVRAILDSDGNLFVAQLDEEFFHDDMANIINDNSKFYMGDAYEALFDKALMNRVLETNNFGLTVSYMDYAEENPDVVNKIMENGKKLHPQFNFYPKYWLDLRDINKGL